MKTKKQKKPTYNFTEEQLQIFIQQYADKKLKEVKADMLTDAMILMLALPMKVLMDSYWKKTYHSKLPGFINQTLAYFQSWENGELDMDELKKELWEYGGIKLERTTK